MRTPTTSITDLVKQVCREEIQKYVDTHDVSKELIAETLCKNIVNSLHKMGDKWDYEEDHLLCDEISVALNQIASNHGRTVNAIRCRIRDKEILK